MDICPCYLSILIAIQPKTSAVLTEFDGWGTAQPFNTGQCNSDMNREMKMVFPSEMKK